MSDDKLVAVLHQIKALLDQALGEPAKSSARRKGKEKQLPKPKPHKVKADLPTHILQLRDDKFFTQPKTATETQAKLQATYACDQNRVAMALLRLFRKKELRKTSKLVGGKKQIAYVW